MRQQAKSTHLQEDPGTAVAKPEALLVRVTQGTSCRQRSFDVGRPANVLVVPHQLLSKGGVLHQVDVQGRRGQEVKPVGVKIGARGGPFMGN